MVLLVATLFGVRSAISASSAAGSPGLPGRSTPSGHRVWVVRPGDTLWGIAEASHPRGDVRVLVDELSAEVHGDALQVGERVEIP